MGRLLGVLRRRDPPLVRGPMPWSRILPPFILAASKTRGDLKRRASRGRESRMPWRVRRVVTGHNDKGRSCFLMDGPAPNVKEMESMPGVALTDLWETVGSPASNAGSADAAARPVRLEPP